MITPAIPTHFLANDELADFLLRNGFAENKKDADPSERLFIRSMPTPRQVVYQPGGDITLYSRGSGYGFGPAIPVVALLFWMQQDPDFAGQRETMNLLSQPRYFLRNL